MFSKNNSLKFLVLKNIGIFFAAPIIGVLLIFKFLACYGHISFSEDIINSYLILVSIFITILFYVLHILFDKRILRSLNGFAEAVESFDPKDSIFDTTGIIAHSNEFRRIKKALIYNSIKLREIKKTQDMKILYDQELLQEKEDETKLLINQLKDAQVALITDEKISSSKVILSSVSHELKNPINVAINSAKVLKEVCESEFPESKEKELTKTMLESIFKNHDKMLNIIDSMLLGNHNEIKKKSSVNIFDQINESFKEVSYVYDVKDLKLNFNNSIESEFSLPGHRLELNRLFINIFQNAIYAIKKKYENSKDSHYLPSIDVSSQQDQGDCLIVVRDNGIGIQKEHLEKILIPFFTTKPNGEGVGLGLHLIKEIVEQHDGSLEVNSVYNEFTEIRIKVPVTLGCTKNESEPRQ